MCESGWNRDARAADLRIRIANVLVGDKAEEFVLEDGTAQRTSRSIAVQPRHFIAGGNIRVGVVEEGSGVEGVCATMDVSAAVQIVRAGGGAHVDVRAAGGALLGVVHGSVDAKFFDGFRRGSGQGLADG